MSDQRVRDHFVRGVDNSVRWCKRSLLDLLDLKAADLREMSASPVRDEMLRLIEMLKRRIHNDVSLVRDQVLAAFEIYTSGGQIPAFGRSEQQLEASRADDRPRRFEPPAAAVNGDPRQ